MQEKDNDDTQVGLKMSVWIVEVSHDEKLENDTKTDDSQVKERDDSSHMLADRQHAAPTQRADYGSAPWLEPSHPLLK